MFPYWFIFYTTSDEPIRYIFLIKICTCVLNLSPITDRRRWWWWWNLFFEGNRPDKNRNNLKRQVNKLAEFVFFAVSSRSIRKRWQMNFKFLNPLGMTSFRQLKVSENALPHQKLCIYLCFLEITKPSDGWNFNLYLFYTIIFKKWKLCAPCCEWTRKTTEMVLTTPKRLKSLFTSVTTLHSRVRGERCNKITRAKDFLYFFFFASNHFRHWHVKTKKKGNLPLKHR